MTSTYFDKIDEIRRNAFRKKNEEANKNSNRKYSLSEDHYKFASNTISLAESPSFTEFMKFIAVERAKFLSHPYKKNPMCERDSLEYVIGFNDGFYKGLLYSTAEIERIWRTYLEIQSQDRKENENKENKENG